MSSDAMSYGARYSTSLANKNPFDPLSPEALVFSLPTEGSILGAQSLIGICTGEKFLRVSSKSRYGGWLRKKEDCSFRTKDQKLDFCPECGHALFWSKTGIGFLTVEELRQMS
jgi:hypothetical protein